MSFLVCSSCKGFIPSQAHQCPHCDEISVQKPNVLMRNAILALTSASISVTLSACYGVPCSQYVTADGESHNSCGLYTTCVLTKEDSLRTGYPICTDFGTDLNNPLKDQYSSEYQIDALLSPYEDQSISVADQGMSMNADQSTAVIIDQGMQMVDQGIPIVDQGMQMVDQGMQMVDQGIPMVDQGIPMVDQGIPMVDQGMLMVDQGIPMVDQGIPMVDQGAGK